MLKQKFYEQAAIALGSSALSIGLVLTLIVPNEGKRVKYCVKVHQFYIRIWCKNAPLKFLCSLLNSPTLAEQNLDAMHGNHIKNQKALSS